MSLHDFHPQTREEYLAKELAERLNDPQGLPLYLKVAKHYSDSFIRRMLGRVLEIPPERIHKSRGALFNWLIHHHDPPPHPSDTPPHPRA